MTKYPSGTETVMTIAAMAGYLDRNRIEPAQILCSPSRRTHETLERMGETFGATIPTRFEKGIYLADVSALLRRLKRLGDVDSVMIVGHNPGLQSLAWVLVGSGEEAIRARLARKFPTGALAVLNADIQEWRQLEAGRARLVDFVCPRDLE